MGCVQLGLLVVVLTQALNKVGGEVVEEGFGDVKDLRGEGGLPVHNLAVGGQIEHDGVVVLVLSKAHEVVVTDHGWNRVGGAHPYRFTG